MPTAGFILSTGRCATQAICKGLQGRPDVLVEHEGLNAHYASRLIFRDKTDSAELFQKYPKVGNKVQTIRDNLHEGISYIDVGWPSFAWMPHLAQAFGAQFRMVHLVRNPFRVAMSLCTHGFFIGNTSRYFTMNAIHATDENVFYPQHARKWDEFSAFEKCLYHWLEVNQFGWECRNLGGYQGVYRFEDIVSEPDTTLQKLSRALSPETSPPQGGLEFTDKVHGGTQEHPDLGHDDLLEDVVDLATRLGYPKQGLLDSYDPNYLSDVYAPLRRMKERLSGNLEIDRSKSS